LHLSPLGLALTEDRLIEQFSKNADTERERALRERGRSLILPDVNHPVWMQIVTGKRPIRSTKATINLLIQGNNMSYEKDPSPLNVAELIDRTHGLFARYGSIFGTEIAEILKWSGRESCSPATGGSLLSISEVHAEIAAGKSLFLAGSQKALSQLPRGNWVGGTICYFMTEEGGQQSEDQIFVTRVPAFALGAEAADYGPENLAHLYRDAPANGFTFLVMPVSTEVLKIFAEQAPMFDGFLMRPVVGWVSGVRLDRRGSDLAAVFNGRTGAVYTDRCVALHVALPANKVADLDIVNIFESGDGPVLRFAEAGFHGVGCLIDGKPDNLDDYICRKRIQTEFPLVGDYNGTAINVSFQVVDPVTCAVDFSAPVFPGVDYHFAKPLADYSAAFGNAIAVEAHEPAFACNCVLNYVHGKLEGRKTGLITGPMTFGEIAHQLLNQTMVRLYLRDVE
jgi:hypothetical protein